MTNTHIADKATRSSRAHRLAQQISALLSAIAASAVVAGIATGFARYLYRSPVREAPVPGTSAWVPHFFLAVVLGALYCMARWRHNRRFGRGAGRLLLLAPVGVAAAHRLAATMRQVTWRTTAALPFLALLGYSFWRIGEQVTAGLDPNFTVNAWGGPSYLGAMACHYLDGALIIAITAWLLDKILLPAASDHPSVPPARAANVTTARTAH